MIRSPEPSTTGRQGSSRSRRERASRGQGAFGAVRTPRQADLRGEVENRPVPLSNTGRWRRRSGGLPQSGIRRCRQIRRKPQVAPIDASCHAIDDRRSLPERHGQRRVRGIPPDAWQLQQAIERPRHLSMRDDRSGHRFQGRCPPDQPQRPDHARDRGLAREAHRSGVRPPAEQRLVDLRDGLPARPLQKHLGDQHPPRIVGLPPRE